MALIMLDWDGVIVDTQSMFTSNLIKACQDSDCGVVKNQAEAMALFDNNFFEAMRHKGLRDQKINQILERFGVLSNADVDNIHPFEEMVEVLRDLSKNHTLIIITSNLSEIPSAVLKKNQLNCIKDVLGAEKEKSKIKKIQKTVAEHRGEDAYYVGDTIGDILEGKQAGVKTVGVAWGWHGAERLREVSPDYLTASPKELKEIFNLQLGV